MATSIFINLPVKDLDASMAFFAKLGFTFNAQFTSEAAASMVISETIYAMLLTHEHFKGFTPKRIADATESTEVLLALSRDSREEVDLMADAALTAGATATRPPEDHGFMYTRAINDLDGHVWEIFWMDPATVNQA